MNKTKIFFWGTPDLAVPSLEALNNNEHVEIVGVGVFPDRKVGRKQIFTPSPVKKRAHDLGLPIYEITSKESLKNISQEVSFDLGIVIAFGMIFPQEVLETPPLGIINIHFSLLPLYRGASPIQGAILAGDKRSGITWQRMVHELDAGDVLYTKEYSIENKSTSQLFDFFGNETGTHMNDFIHQYTHNNIDPQPQDEKKATFCGKFTKQDGAISFKADSSQEIHRKALAFDVWPEVFVETKIGNVKLFVTSLEEHHGYASIECANNTILWVQYVQIPGKQKSLALDVLRNHPDIFTI